MSHIKKKFLSLLDSIKKILSNSYIDSITAFSGEATLFVIISFLPFIIFFLLLLRFTPLSSDYAIDTLLNSMPVTFRSYVLSIIKDILSPNTAVISISTITVLWAASRGFLAIVHGFNVIYKTGETRNDFILRFFSILYTIGFAIILIVTLALLVFGNRISNYIFEKIPNVIDLTTLIVSTRNIVILFILLVFFLILYIFVPNRKTNLLREMPGAIFTSVIWLLFSYAFSFYVDYCDFSSMYGSLSSIFLIMIWMYFCMYFMFIGAEINHSFGAIIEEFILEHNTFKRLKKNKKQRKKQS